MMKNGKKSKPDIPILLIQQINLQWYKDCRGGAGAVLRNHYPKAARLPEDYFSCYPFGVPAHSISLLQDKAGIHVQKDFRVLKEWRNDSTVKFDPFELSNTDGKPKIYYRFDLHRGALPERLKYDPNTSRYVPLHELAFELEPVDYGRAVCNGRFVDWDTGNWWYEMDILNIMFQPDPDIPLDCFLARKPNKTYQQIAQLW